jgi:TRAP-type C4-dicarboxylate transport system permease large subunit
VWFAFCTLSSIWCAFISQVVAIFGVFVRGVAAHLLFALFAVLYGYCVWGFYKLRKDGWWAAVGTSVFWIASTAVSMIVLGPARMMSEALAQTKIDPQQASALAQMPPQFMTWVLVISTLLGAAFMAMIIYCKPYFNQSKPATAENP